MRSLWLAMTIALIAGRAAADGPERLPVGGYDWTGWASLGGVAVSAPECVAPGEGRLDCFVRGQDGQLMRRTFEGGIWQPWTKAGGLANAAYYNARPECVGAQPGQVDCFVRRHGDGTLYRRTWLGSYMHSWEQLGGALASDPECVVRGSRIDCFARGEDGALWQNAFDGDAWGGWISRGGTIAEGTKPACGVRGDDAHCLAVWAGKKTLHHFDGSAWDEVDGTPVALPSTENVTASAKCVSANDRLHCFAPVAAPDGARMLRRFVYDGSWRAEDVGSALEAGLAHYDFDCVVRTKGRFDCMDLAVLRDSGPARKVRFRHFTHVPGAPAEWREVPLTMPVEAGDVTFLRCLSADGARIDCFTGGNWRGNSTLNQASLVYQEKLVFRPMNPVR